MIVSTDNLRAIADEMDESGIALDGFVLVAVEFAGPRVRVLGSIEDNATNAEVLSKAIKMLRGGALQ